MIHLKLPYSILYRKYFLLSFSLLENCQLVMKPSSMLSSGIWTEVLTFTPTSLNTQSLQSCLTLCNPMECRPPGSSILGFSRQEYWCGLAHPPPGDLPDPGIEPTSLMSPALAGRFLTTSTTWEALHKHTSILYCHAFVLHDVTLLRYYSLLLV